MAERPDELASGARELTKRYPGVWEAFSALGAACADAGPVDARTAWLVKLALAIGASSEGAVHYQCRRALSEGVSGEELKHVALLAIPTLGFPKAVRVLTWIEDITDPGGRSRET